MKNSRKKSHKSKIKKRIPALSGKNMLKRYDTIALIRFVIAVIAAVFLVIFLWHLFSSNAKADYTDTDVAKNLKTIERFDFSNVSAVEEEMDALKTQEKSNTSKSDNKAAYQKAFRGSIVLGDSVTEGLSAYGYLPTDIVFSKIGASVAKDSSLFTKAASTLPKNAFFAMGMNDMGNYKGDPEGFVEQYKKCLTEFQEASPKTKIFICSISHPSESAIQKKSWLGSYDAFNKQIKEMCKELKYTYIDVSNIFEKHPDLYEKDGIHASSEYYPYWLQMMANAADLDLDI